MLLPPVWSCCAPCQDWAWGSSGATCGSSRRRLRSRWCPAEPPSGACAAASWFAGENPAPGVWVRSGVERHKVRRLWGENYSDCARVNVCVCTSNLQSVSSISASASLSPWGSDRTHSSCRETKQIRYIICYQKKYITCLMTNNFFLWRM